MGFFRDPESRDKNPKSENPMGFQYPGIGIFFVGWDIPAICHLCLEVMSQKVCIKIISSPFNRQGPNDISHPSSLMIKCTQCTLSTFGPCRLKINQL